MKTIIIILSMFLLSCVDFPDPQFYITPELEEYYDNFKKEAELRGIIIPDDNLIMVLTDGHALENGGNAIYKNGVHQDYIYVEREHFKKRGILIEMTVFHELGHAKLGRGHSSGWSLMNYKISGGQSWPMCYGEPCSDLLIDELFGLKKR